MIDIPPALFQKCFIPYSERHAPSLGLVPITVDGPEGDTSDLASIRKKANFRRRIKNMSKLGTSWKRTNTVSLSRILMQQAQREIEDAFFSMGHSIDEKVDASKPNTTLPVTAICSPEYNSHVPVDAAVRLLAYNIKADIVIVDPADFAAGRTGVLGELLTEAFWGLYRIHLPGIVQNDNGSPSGGGSDCNSSSDGKTSKAKLEDLMGNINQWIDNSGTAEWQRDPAYMSAKAAVQAYFLMGSSEDSDDKNRRIIYIRDFGSFYKVMLPLLPAFLDLLASHKNMIIVVGISPVDRIQHMNISHTTGKSGYDSLFHSILRGPNFLDYLEERQNAQWRKLRDGEYSSLEDTFSAAFINRYQGAFLGRHDEGNMSLRMSAQPRLKFERLLRIACTQPIPRALNDFLLMRRRRFLSVNLWHLQSIMTRISKSISYNMEELSSLPVIESQSSDPRNTIQRRALDRSELQRIADLLPPHAALLDVVATLSKISFPPSTQEVDAEWLRLLRYITSRMHISSAKHWSSFVDQIRPSDALSSDETAFLDYVVDPGAIHTTFEDVCLNPEIIETLRTAVSLPILFPQAFQTGILAKEAVGGVLLFGPPGTGKTMACRALAKECGARMLQLTASNILDCYVGNTEKKIAAVFSLARKIAPCVLFIDEIDGLFKKRDGSSKSWERSQMTEFMQEIDGLLTAELGVRKRVIVVGATNRPQDLDAAIVRRLSDRVLVDLPTIQQRKRQRGAFFNCAGTFTIVSIDIIRKYLDGENVDATVNIDAIAGKTPLFSGSDLRNLVLAAALAALKQNIKISWDMEYGDDGLPRPAKAELTPRIICGSHFDLAVKQMSASGATNRKELDELRRWQRELFQSDYCT